MSDQLSELLAENEQLRDTHARTIQAMQSQIAAAEKERDEWKANHDNQVEIKKAVLDRPDLKERAGLVLKLIAERDGTRKWYEDEKARADRLTSRLASEENMLAKFQLGPLAQQVVDLSDEVMVLARAQTDSMFVLRLARRIWRDLKHALDDLPEDKQSDYRWRLRMFGRHLGRTEDYKTHLHGLVMELECSNAYLTKVIKELNEHEGAEGWSFDLRVKVNKILEKS